MARQFMKLYCDILPRKDLTPAAKVVYTVLSDQIRGNPAGEVPIGLRRLAKLAGLTVATVARAVTCLAERTDLEVDRGRWSRLGSGHRNIYRLPPETVLETRRPDQESAADSVRGCVQNETPAVADSVRKRSKNGTKAYKKRDTYQNRPENKDQTHTRAADCQAIMDYWNEHRGKPRARTLTAGRQRKLTTRLAEPAFAAGWREAIDRLRKAPAGCFLNGGGDRGWRADFDWFIRDGTNYVRVLEGFGQEAPGSVAPADRQFDPTLKWDVRGNPVQDGSGPPPAQKQEWAERWLNDILPDDFEQIRLELCQEASRRNPVQAGPLFRTTDQRAFGSLVHACPLLVTVVLERACAV